MDKETRSAIERATQRGRKLLEEDFREQLAADFDILDSGVMAAEAGKHLTGRQPALRAKIVAAIDHKKATGMDGRQAVADYVRDAAFTTLNRFAALKMLEARDLLLECISKGDQSAGYREMCGLGPGVALLPNGAGYRLYIESLFDELSTEVKVLFDRRDAASVLWPRRPTFEALLGLLNAPELARVWGEDETIGWVYQYFNSGEERRAMRDASQTPRNSRELAVRNQFFTPRYVVQFLTDNTLGRIWHQMRGGRTRLVERCEYLVRRSQEVLLADVVAVGDGQPWLAQVRKGDFKALPDPFTWAESVHFAHLIDGYDLAPALGLGEAHEVYKRLFDEHERSGRWEGSAIELWIALFMAHRADRHHGLGFGEGPSELHDSLCRTLREKLVAAQETDDITLIPVRRKKDPRDLKILDPACGSGHFLLYAFDLLAIIYEESWEDGHSSNPPSEVTGKTLRDDYATLEELRRALPGLILRHNLHGVDIDPRCAQIAQLALWMRAQRAYKEAQIPRAERAAIRRSNVVIAEPMPGDEELVKAFAAGLRPPLLGELFQNMVGEMRLAGELGSLLRVEDGIAAGIKKARGQYVKAQRGTGFLPAPGMAPEKAQGELDLSGIDDDGFFHEAEGNILDALRSFAESAAGSAGVRRRMFAEDAVQGMALIDLVRTRFDVVLMNPPFGAGSAIAKGEFERRYLRTKSDLCAAFVERGVQFLENRCMLGAITSRTGFFLSSFQRWREEVLLKEAPPTVLADLGFGVLDGAMVEVAAYCLEVAS